MKKRLFWQYLNEAVLQIKALEGSDIALKKDLDDMSIRELMTLVYETPSPRRHSPALGQSNDANLQKVKDTR